MKQINLKFKAFRVEENGEKFDTSVKEVAIDSIDQGEVIIKVHYSSLNYKDALSSIGNKGVTRNYPHTPGIDAVGVVHMSESDQFKEGDEVIVTSYDLGMNTDGGFGEYIKVPADWVVNLPKGMDMKETMIIGTAGLTAGMSVLRLTENIKPEDGKIAVSGATGGVGSVTVSLLTKLGYTVVGITGKDTDEEKEYLKQLGAAEIITRAEIEDFAAKPLLKPLFAGGIDTVGGVILENIIKSTGPLGTVTCCGNAASIKLDLTVFPFILRGVQLIGIDSQNYPMKYRKQVWEKLADAWKLNQEKVAHAEVTLDGLNEKIGQILKGQIKGRTVVKVAE